MTFEFDLKDARLVALLNHCKQHWQHHAVAYSGGTERVEKPSLTLVKDSGVYLMCPSLMKGAPPEAFLLGGSDSETRAHVVYADGYGPRVFVGGDDFAETLPFVDEMLEGVAGGKGRVLIRLTAKHISIAFA